MDTKDTSNSDILAGNDGQPAVPDIQRNTVVRPDIEERYIALFERSRDAVYVHDFAGVCIDANQATLDLIGCDKTDLPRLNLLSLVVPVQSPAMESALKELRATGVSSPHEFTVTRKDGSTVDVETTSFLIYRKHKPVAVMGIARDISERTRMDEALRRSEWFYRLLADNVTDMVWLMDTNLKILYVSPSSEKLRGFTCQELLAMPVAKHLTPSSLQKGMAVFSREMAKLEKNPAHTFNETLELEFYCKDGATFWSESSFSIVKDEEGKPMGILGVGRDITQRRKSEDDLRKINERLYKAMNGAVETISMISELRDPYTAGHQNQVAKLSAAIAEEMGLPEKKVAALRMAGTLHDIGKVSIPSEILSKPGRLNKIEVDMIRDHPRVGKEILKTIDFPFPICRYVAEHHERVDGSGYPAGLKGSEISIEARILAVADVVSAISSHRPYRPALGMDKAIEEITLNKGTLFDPEVVDACVRLFTQKGFKLEL
jgi:PAS domain S-box-containing protein/putative nucleotidyltransferase with HDIG domain